MSSIKNYISDEQLLTKKAPAAISRNTELPEIEPDISGNIPYCVVSKNPNGVFGIATLGRTMERDYFIPKCKVTIDIGNSKTIGIFGEYRELNLKNSFKNISRILMQDLADDTAYDITEAVNIGNGEISIPGDIISKIGRISQPKDDTSEPGALIKIESN